MEAIVLIAMCLFGLFMLALPCMLSVVRGHNSALAISVLGFVGGILTPFTLITSFLWFVALIWSLTPPK